MGVDSQAVRGPSRCLASESLALTGAVLRRPLLSTHDAHLAGVAATKPRSCVPQRPSGSPPRPAGLGPRRRHSGAVTAPRAYPVSSGSPSRPTGLGPRSRRASSSPRAPHRGLLAWDPDADTLRRLLGRPPLGPLAWDSDADALHRHLGCPPSEVDATDTRRAATERSSAPSGAARLAWPWIRINPVIYRVLQ